MNDRNRSDLDREQRNASNPTERPENRSTRQDETDRMGGNQSGNQGRDQAVGNEGRTGSEHEGAGNRSTGNIEGDENLNRR